MNVTGHNTTTWVLPPWTGTIENPDLDFQYWEPQMRQIWKDHGKDFAIEWGNAFVPSATFERITGHHKKRCECAGCVELRAELARLERSMLFQPHMPWPFDAKADPLPESDDIVRDGPWMTVRGKLARAIAGGPIP